MSSEKKKNITVAKKPKATRAPKTSPLLDDINFSPVSDDDEPKQYRPRVGRPANNNETAKSRLSVIIDILSGDDTDMDEKTLRRNVNTSLKHLKEVVSML